MNDLVAVDESPEGTHLDPDVDLGQYTYDKLLEYWAMVRTLGLLGGVIGTEDEQKAARAAIMAALEDAAEAAVGYLDAVAIAADDYSLPGLGVLKQGIDLTGLHAADTVLSWFDADRTALQDAIKRNEAELRDSIAVDVNQTSRVIRIVKVGLEDLTQSTWLPDYTAETSIEEQLIAETQATVDARRAKVVEALERLWNGVKEVALARYNQFLADLEAGGFKYALGTLAIDGAFVALEIAIGVVAGVVTGGAGAVVLKVAVSIGKKIGNAGRKISIVIRSAADKSGKSGLIEMPEADVVELGATHKGFGDDLGGLPKSTKDSNLEDGKPDVETDGSHRREDGEDEKLDQAEDGSYRKAGDPDGVRRAPDGEAMVQNKDGTWTRISETSNNTKGRFGEMMADDWAAKQDPPWIKVNGPNSDMNTPGHQGVDSVYKNPNPPPDYFVTDAKYGKAGLGKLVDGTKQMSPDWIRRRVKDAFSKRETRRILNSYEAEILRVDKDGNVARESLEGRVWREEDL